MVPTATRGCLDDEVILRFVEGRLPARAWQDAKGHIASCEECRTLVAETAKLYYSGSTAEVESVGGKRRVHGAAVREPRQVGRYAIRSRLGEGAMGVVYLAHDAQLDREIALKLLRAGSVAEEEIESSRTRLLREAQAMAKVAHPNVVAVHDAGTFEDQVFIVMEYVPGRTLRAWLNERSRGFAEILDTFIQAGRGLAAAHAAKIVHRDFKPENVLVDREGRVRVTDFGLACLDRADANVVTAGASLLQVAITHTGAFLGTPAYMAPEQLAGRVADAKSDQFGFCVALYEALSGRRPFAGDDLPALLKAVQAGPPPGLTDGRPFPPALNGVLARGLQVNPDERFPSMAKLLEALMPFSARFSRYFATGLRKGRRAWLVAGGALLVVGVGVVIAAGGARRASHDQASRAGQPISAPRTLAHADELASPPVIVPAPMPAPRVAEPPREPPLPRASAPRASTPRTSSPPRLHAVRKKPPAPVQASAPARAPRPGAADGDALKPLDETP